MKEIAILENKIQHYAWGSKTSIPDLIGRPELIGSPCAELWMGAHPKSPSYLRYQGKDESLFDLIQKSPKEILGDKISDKYGDQLPFLFKVLAAARPLSIQAHPSQSRAIVGFEEENQKNIPLDAPNRNYKDKNHKPECICALSDFWALKGFRSPADISEEFKRISVSQFLDELQILDSDHDLKLKTFFNALMNMDKSDQIRFVNAVVQAIDSVDEDNAKYFWVKELNRYYPGDIGVLSPLILNLICLTPGQAMYLPAGEFHAYLDGLAIELMANSDNVLRGGLTPKHIDVQELLTVLNFDQHPVDILLPEKINRFESVYDTPADEFRLSMIQVENDCIYGNIPNQSVQVIICTHGYGTIFGDDDHAILLEKGTSVFIPSLIKSYNIQGHGIFYKASVPV